MRRGSASFDLFGEDPSPSDPRTLYTPQELAQAHTRDLSALGSFLGHTSPPSAATATVVQQQQPPRRREIPPHLRPAPAPAVSPPRREEPTAEDALPAPREGTPEASIESTLRAMDDNNALLAARVDDMQHAVEALQEVLDTQRGLTAALREQFAAQRRANGSRGVLVRVLEADDEQRRQAAAAAAAAPEDWW